METFGVDIKWEDARRWARRAWQQMMPAPSFGSPSPEITREDEGEMQWWHIPIHVRRHFFRRDIPCCRAVMVFIDEKQPGEEFELRWRSDLGRGSSEQTLIYDARRMLPIVARRDGAPSAILTDNTFLMMGIGRYSVAGTRPILTRHHLPDSFEPSHLQPGKYKFKLRITSGAKEWESGPIYELNVPNGGQSNGHFTLTMRA